MLLCSVACPTGPLPGPGSAHACPTNCPRLQRSDTAPHKNALLHFSLAYFDAWSVDSSSNTDVVLVAQTDHGRISVLRSGLAPPFAPMHREAHCSGADASRISSSSYGDSITPDAHRSPDSRKRHGQLRDASSTLYPELKLRASRLRRDFHSHAAGSHFSHRHAPAKILIRRHMACRAPRADSHHSNSKHKAIPN